MAIKFVDKEPEGEKPKPSTKAGAPPAAREPDGEALRESVNPELTHVKPAQKRGGRRKAD